MRALAPLILLLLAACQPLPQPFADDARRDNPLALLRSGAGVGIVVSGLPEPVAAVVSQAAAEAFTAAEVPATVGRGSRASFVLVGDGAVEREAAGLVLSVVWRLADADGHPVGEFGERVPLVADAWPGRDELVALGGRSATAFVDAVREAPPGAAEPHGVLVLEPDGAPGDGAVALKRAMEAVLSGQGVLVAKIDGAKVAKLKAVVAVGPAEAGAQPVRLRWQLLRPDGQAVGSITQANAVKAGTLDRNWGDTALLIAEAAYDGVAQLLRRLPESVQSR